MIRIFLSVSTVTNPISERYSKVWKDSAKGATIQHGRACFSPGCHLPAHSKPSLPALPWVKQTSREDGLFVLSSLYARYPFIVFQPYSSVVKSELVVRLFVNQEPALERGHGVAACRKKSLFLRLSVHILQLADSLLHFLLISMSITIDNLIFVLRYPQLPQITLTTQLLERINKKLKL